MVTTAHNSRTVHICDADDRGTELQYDDSVTKGQRVQASAAAPVASAVPTQTVPGLMWLCLLVV